MNGLITIALLLGPFMLVTAGWLLWRRFAEPQTESSEEATAIPRTPAAPRESPVMHEPPEADERPANVTQPTQATAKEMTIATQPTTPTLAAHATPQPDEGTPQTPSAMSASAPNTQEPTATAVAESPPAEPEAAISASATDHATPPPTSEPEDSPAEAEPAPPTARTESATPPPEPEPQPAPPPVVSRSAAIDPPVHDPAWRSLAPASPTANRSRSQPSSRPSQRTPRSATLGAIITDTMKPNTLIIRTAGTNCDRELAHAFERAGAATRMIHLNTLIREPGLIDAFDLIGLPGGFSYGDDIAAGRILANRLRHRLLSPLREAVKCGVPIIGICNGFQALVKMGLLPDPAADTQQATLADNTSGRFVDRWVRLHAPHDTACIWTTGLDDLELPIAHGEGRFVPASPQLLERWQSNGQVALRYAADDNPNGSVDDIAGVCDPTGRVLGLMPHPERYTHATHHPHWTRQDAESLAQTPAGLRIFQNAVEYAKARSTAAASQAAGV